jgi:hypothetical protein
MPQFVTNRKILPNRMMVRVDADHRSVFVPVQETRQVPFH